MIHYVTLAFVLVLTVLAPSQAFANNGCGGNGQRECNVWEQVPSCDSGLSASGGRCHNCGDVGEMECAVTVQVPSCDPNLMAVNGTCQRCGGQGERVCTATVLPAGCRDNLIGQNGTCQPCGNLNEEACRSLTLEASCASENLVISKSNTWFTCVPCGHLGNRPCPASTGVAPCEGTWRVAKVAESFGPVVCRDCGGGPTPFRGENSQPTCDATDWTGSPQAECRDGWFPIQPVNTLPPTCSRCGERGAPPCDGGVCNDELWNVDGECKHCVGHNSDHDCPASEPTAAPAPRPAPAQPRAPMTRPRR